MKKITPHYHREAITAVGLSIGLTALMLGLGAICIGLLGFSDWPGAFGGPGATRTVELRAAAPGPRARPVAAAPARPATSPPTVPAPAARPVPTSPVPARAPSRRRTVRH